jgi:hypothetical protein
MLNSCHDPLHPGSEWSRNFYRDNAEQTILQTKDLSPILDRDRGWTRDYRTHWRRTILSARKNNPTFAQYLERRLREEGLGRYIP